MKRNQVVELGRVRCPVRGEDVDIEGCMRCHRLTDMDLGSERPHIVCEYEATRGGWLNRVTGVAQDLARELRVQAGRGRRGLD